MRTCCNSQTDLSLSWRSTIFFFAFKITTFPRNHYESYTSQFKLIIHLVMVMYRYMSMAGMSGPASSSSSSWNSGDETSSMVGVRGYGFSSQYSSAPTSAHSMISSVPLVDEFPFQMAANRNRYRYMVGNQSGPSAERVKADGLLTTIRFMSPWLAVNHSDLMIDGQRVRLNSINSDEVLLGRTLMKKLEKLGLNKKTRRGPCKDEMIYNCQVDLKIKYKGRDLKVRMHVILITHKSISMEVVTRYLKEKVIEDKKRAVLDNRIKVVKLVCFVNNLELVL